MLKIMELIQAKEYTAEGLRGALNRYSNDDEVSLRLVQRYLFDLEMMGKVKVDNRRRPPLYRASRELDPVEALVTHLALRMLYHQTPGYNEVYLSGLQKLAHQLPSPAQEIALESVKEHKNRRQELGAALSVVAQGWFSGRVISFDYLKPGGSGTPRFNELEVYFIEINRTNLGVYVIGKERKYHQAVRNFKLNRMRRVQLTGDNYEIDPEFNPRDFLFNAWGVMGKSGGGLVEVVLRFRPDAAEWVEELNYPGVKSKCYGPDGSLEMRLEVGSDNHRFPLELKSWVQGWGSRVEVIAPPDLRQEWLGEARKVAQYPDRAEADHA